MRALAASFLFAMVNLTIAPPAAAGRLEPGVSLELAQWRAKHYRDIRYGLRMRLAEGADRLEGTLDLSVTLPARKADLVLDWRGEPVRGLLVNGKSVPYDVKNEHLVVQKELLKSGRNTVRLEFESPVAVSGARSRATRTARTARSTSTRCSCPRTRARSSPASTSRT